MCKGKRSKRKQKKKHDLPADYGLPPEYLISDELWQAMQQCLPPPKPKLKAGRPRMEDRQAMTAILYVLRTGLQWAALPRSLGAKSTVHDRFQAWITEGVFVRLWQQGLLSLEVMQKLNLEWQAADGSVVKAPLGGEKNRAQPHRPGQAGMQA